MNTTLLIIDFGERAKEARRYRRNNREMRLGDFLRVFPARFPKGSPPTDAQLNQPLADFEFNPCRLEDDNACVIDCGSVADGLGNELDRLFAQDQEGPASEPLPCLGNVEDQQGFPETISDDEAVRSAYRQEMDTIADFLKNDLSVLVVCDKILTEYIYEWVCDRAGKSVVLETDPPGQTDAPPPQTRGKGSQLDEAIQGQPAGDSLKNLPALIRGLRPDQVMVLRSLDMQDTPPVIELLYQRTASGLKPQFLAFLDPSLEVKKVLLDRFAVHVPLMGLPRYAAASKDRDQPVFTVSGLITRKERHRFKRFEPEGLYKNVAGLNAVQFRNAMKYVGARVAENTDPTDIYRVIRQFKTSSTGEIEIPDITFGDIGGYEHVKQELKRIITLITGSVQGLEEKHKSSLTPRGFIFHGPPGTGKTLFAKAIANEMNATIQMVSGPEIMDKYVGQSESNIRQLFAVARRNAPAVIFFDEFDSIVSKRSTYSDGGSRANNAVVAQFLTELDGFRQDQAVLVIGTTNRIDIIDKALLRPSRLKAIEIGLPDFTARRSVASIHAKNFHLDTLIKETYQLTADHLETWQKSGDGQSQRIIPKAFLDCLFARHAPYGRRYAFETRQIGFLKDLEGFFQFLDDCREIDDGGDGTPIIDRMTEKIIEIGKRYGLDLSGGSVPVLDDVTIPMQNEIRGVFDMLQDARKSGRSLTPEAFLDALLDLVAEYTVDYNNDEIRAVFQECSMEYHMSGQLITPFYVGQKIGMIRRRKDEHETVHLPDDSRH